MYVDPLLLFCKCIYIAAMRQKGNSMNLINNNTNPIIIGIDHGYGNIKTAHPQADFCVYPPCGGTAFDMGKRAERQLSGIFASK